MKKRKNNPEPLVLHEGYFVDTYYTNYSIMENSAKNWKYNCFFQLKPNALSGHHRILQLSSLQLGYVSRPGGLMHNTFSALDCICVAVVEKCADKACFHRTKLKVGDIIFCDSSRSHNFVTSDSIDFIVVNIKTKVLGSLQPKFSQAFNHKIKDTNGIFSALLNDIWEQYTNTSEEKRVKSSLRSSIEKSEEKIISVINTLLETQTPAVSKLTQGEEVALAIRDQVYAHMDGKISIASLAKQYKVSEGTLQNNFKSLFGFTPKYFFRQMKLNLVYRDLREADSRDETVSDIARRWGFMHMGHFSNYYTELFGENPSQTLKRPYISENRMGRECVERQEEMM